MTASVFLDPDDIRRLTGRGQKSKQAKVLRDRGIPFYLNASGQPVVARAVVEGDDRKEASAAPQAWRPAVLGT